MEQIFANFSELPGQKDMDLFSTDSVFSYYVEGILLV